MDDRFGIRVRLGGCVSAPSAWGGSVGPLPCGKRQVEPGAHGAPLVFLGASPGRAISPLPGYVGLRGVSGDSRETTEEGEVSL
jgi:hypothetical protein